MFGRSKRIRHVAPGQPVPCVDHDVTPCKSIDMPMDTDTVVPAPQQALPHQQPQGGYIDQPDPPSPASSNCSDPDVCWICLDSSTSACQLIRPCACPRTTHAKCIARWQLQSAGTRRETHCDFCGQQLPDWKQVLTVTGPSAVRAPAVMTVTFNGRTFFFHVEPGPEGYRKFTADVKAAFTLPDDCDLNITFTCDEPAEPRVDEEVVAAAAEGPASLLTLQGAGAYDAAVHCAAISAAKRLAMRQAGMVGGRKMSEDSRRSSVSFFGA